MFAAQLIDCEVIAGVLMPIRIKRLDKNCALMQQPVIPLLLIEAVPFSQASYTAVDTTFGVLCGLI